MSLSIKISNKKSTKGSHFDGSQIFHVKQTSFLLRHRSSHKLLLSTSPSSKQASEYEKLAKFIKKSKKQYIMEKLKNHEILDELDFIRMRQTELKNGDSIKIGNERLEIKTISLDGKDAFFDQNKLGQPSNIISIGEYDDLSQTPTNQDDLLHTTCSYCYSSGADFENPLIDPCSCNDRKKAIHKNCLKIWIMNQIHYVENLDSHIFRYQEKQLKCQACQFKYQIKSYLPYFNDHPVKNYLEVIKNPHQSDAIHYFINLDQLPQIQIGRKLSNHLIFENDQASRHHCTIFFDRQKKQVFCESSGAIIFHKKMLLFNDKNEYEECVLGSKKVELVYQKRNYFFNKLKQFLLGASSE